MLTYDDYLLSIREKLSSHFDLSASRTQGKRTYDLFGKMNIKNAKYLVTEKVQIYGYENDEYLWLRELEAAGGDSIKGELDSLKAQIPLLVEPRKGHMSSLLTLVLVTGEEIGKEHERLARRFRYQKGFALGFRGWADLILVIVSLKENRVVTHRNFMKTAGFFQPEKVCPKERA